jgi:hypothetical protein
VDHVCIGFYRRDEIDCVIFLYPSEKN